MKEKNAKKNNNAVEQSDVLVSICVTSYNRAQGLDKVLTCLTQQTHKLLKIIVSDDCSPDKNIEKIILSHAERDERIEYYIQEQNIFYFKNLKFVLDKADGDFVMWCDDDDWYHPTYVEKCLTALLKDDKAITAFSLYNETDEIGEINTTYPNQAVLLERLTNKNTVFRMLAYLFAYNGYGYCNIYYGLHRRSILSWFNPEKHGMALDMDVGMKLISLTPLVLVREYLYKKNVGTKKEYSQVSLYENSKTGGKILFLKIYSILISHSGRVIDYCKILRLDHAIIIAFFAPIWISSLIVIGAFNYFKKIEVYNNRKIHSDFMKIFEKIKFIENYLPSVYDTRYSKVFTLYSVDVNLKKLKVNVNIDNQIRQILVAESPHFQCALEILANVNKINPILHLDKNLIPEYLELNGLIYSEQYIRYVEQAHPETSAIESYVDFLHLIQIMLRFDDEYKLNISALVKQRIDLVGNYYWLLIDGLHRCSILLALNRLTVRARVKFI